MSKTLQQMPHNEYQECSCRKTKGTLKISLAWANNAEQRTMVGIVRIMAIMKLFLSLSLSLAWLNTILFFLQQSRRVAI